MVNSFSEKIEDEKVPPSVESVEPELVKDDDTSQTIPSSTFPLFNFFRRRKPQAPKVDLDAIATQPSVYDDPDQAQYYAAHEKYENLHRFNPSARWTWREEHAVIRKIDWKIMTWVSTSIIAYLAGN